MEGKIEIIFSTFLVVSLCATVLLRPGLAEVQTTPRFPTIPGSPVDITKCCSAVLSHTTPQFPFIHGSPVDLTKCLSSLVSVQGCVTEIYKSLFTGKFDNVGAMCCKEF
ncbi:hypothetical protein N665_0372s0010 [Sinapis alba]|nr:hypothetical protein N665_0372s0010 [Sinapis alba]